MTAEERVRLAFDQMSKKTIGTFLATVTANHPETDYVDVKDMDGVAYDDVRKRAAITEGTDGIIITPAVGSWVIVSRIAGSDELFIEMFSQVYSVVIDGGVNGGLIKINDHTAKINELVDKVNSLVNSFNNHTHIVNTAGSATAQTGTAQAIVTKASQAAKLVVSDFENVKIKH